MVVVAGYVDFNNVDFDIADFNNAVRTSRRPLARADQCFLRKLSLSCLTFSHRGIFMQGCMDDAGHKFLSVSKRSLASR